MTFATVPGSRGRMQVFIPGWQGTAPNVAQMPAHHASHPVRKEAFPRAHRRASWQIFLHRTFVCLLPPVRWEAVNGRLPLQNWLRFAKTGGFAIGRERASRTQTLFCETKPFGDMDGGTRGESPAPRRVFIGSLAAKDPPSAAGRRLHCRSRGLAESSSIFIEKLDRAPLSAD
jgi:hypothetical protein